MNLLKCPRCSLSYAKIVPTERHELAQMPEVQPILCKSTKNITPTTTAGAKSIGHPLKRGKGRLGAHPTERLMVSARATAAPSDFALVAVTVVGSVGHDDVVQKVDTHSVAGAAHTVGEAVVITAGAWTATGMVVTESQHGGVGQ